MGDRCWERVKIVFMEKYCKKRMVELGFFFQAEDGIRDVAVTGVQTCALPILCPRVCVPPGTTSLCRSNRGIWKHLCQEADRLPERLSLPPPSAFYLSSTAVAAGDRKSVV